MATTSIDTALDASNDVPHPAPAETVSAEVVASEPHVNGLASQHNAIDALPSSAPTKSAMPSQPLELPDAPQNSVTQSVSAELIEPINKVTSGIEPVASFLENGAHVTEKVDSEHNTAGSSGVPTSAPPLNGHVDEDTAIVEDNIQKISQDTQDQNLSPQAVELAQFQEPLLPTQNQDVGIEPDTESLLQQSAEPVPEPVDEIMVDAIPSTTKVARPRDDDEEVEPLAKRARTETPADSGQMIDGLPDELSSAAVHPSVENTPAAPPPVTQSSTAPATAGTSDQVKAQPAVPVINWGPMTESQKRVLTEGIRTMKKSKFAIYFTKPVDPVALNIPRYPEVIKHPMDLSTMDQKLKSGQYPSVNEYVADFDQMVQNTTIFNGPDHLVTQSAVNLRTVLNAQLKKLPRAGDHPPVEPPKKPARKPSVSTPKEPKPHTPRPSLGARPAVAAPEQIYALDHDGMPQIRRHSSMTDGRPKREIHKPPPKDLPYSAKPKKKKFQLELKFAQETLDEVMRPAYANTIGAPFMVPVDPVALNIPNYRSIIKKPMDFTTVRDKLQAGLYENAREFENDVRLIFQNCYKFNGKDHPVSKMGQDFEKAFDDQWVKKNDWMAKHAPPSAPQSPEGDESEEEEEEVEEEDDGEAERQAQLQAIHGQFAQLSAQLLALQNQPAKKSKAAPAPTSKKSTKAGKVGQTKNRRKSSSVPGAANLPIRSDKKTKPKQKALKPITNAQKEEISEKIGLLSAEQMGRAAEIIRASLRRAGRSDLADKAEDEMEFEIDQIPEDALHELLKLVRKAVPNAKSEDTEYGPPPTSKGTAGQSQGKSRKNKPMKSIEQDQQIDRIKAQLDSFQHGNAGLGNAGNGVMKEEADSSGDESDSGSESEEE